METFARKGYGGRVYLSLGHDGPAECVEDGKPVLRLDPQELLARLGAANFVVVEIPKPAPVAATQAEPKRPVAEAPMQAFLKARGVEPREPQPEARPGESLADNMRRVARQRGLTPRPAA